MASGLLEVLISSSEGSEPKRTYRNASLRCGLNQCFEETSTSKPGTLDQPGKDVFSP